MEGIALHKRLLEQQPNETQQKRVHLLGSGFGVAAGAANPMMETAGGKPSSDPAPSPPSAGRVLLVRNLGRETTELDIEILFSPFSPPHAAKPPKIFLRQAAGHAFVELADESVAASALAFFTANPVDVKGSIIQVSYSMRESVTTNEEKAETFKVLLVSVTKLAYNVDIDTLHGLFSRFGYVEKIISFEKAPGMHQAFVQYRDASDAKRAMLFLHNRHMYENCNVLQVQPSRLSEIRVRSNDRAKAWDFTLEPTIPGPAQLPAYIGPGTAEYSGGNYGSSGPQPYPQAIFNQAGSSMDPTSGGQTTVLICYNLSPEHINAQKLFNLFSIYGYVMRIKILRDKQDTALIQFSSPFYAQLARTNLNEASMHGRKLQLNASKNTEIKISPLNGKEDEDYTNRTMEFQKRDQRYKPEESDKYTRSACKPTATLFVANIAEGVTSEDLLSNFRTVGNVKGIEFRPPKEGSNKQMAVIGMESEEEAIAGICNFHNFPVKGCGLKIAFSRAVVG